MRFVVRGTETGPETPTDHEFPTYGYKGCVEGVVEFLSSSSVERIEAKVSYIGSGQSSFL